MILAPFGTESALTSFLTSETASFLGRYFSTYAMSCSQIYFSSSQGSRFASSSSLAFFQASRSASRAAFRASHSRCFCSRTALV